MNLLDCCQHAEAAFFADSLKLIICKQNVFLTLSDLEPEKTTLRRKSTNFAESISGNRIAMVQLLREKWLFIQSSELSFVAWETHCVGNREGEKI